MDSVVEKKILVNQENCVLALAFCDSTWTLSTWTLSLGFAVMNQGS